MEKRKLIGRRDLVLLAVFLVIGLILLAWWQFRPAAAGGIAEVAVDGEVVAELPLAEDAEMVIEGYDGGENTLVIRDGESIICLPNRVVVTIRGGEEGNVDGVA